MLIVIGDSLRTGNAWAYAQLALGTLGFFWCALCALLLAMRWKVPALVATAPLLLHALIVVGGTGSPVPPPGLTDAEKVMVLVEAIAQTLASGTLGVLALPSAMVLALGAAIGGARGPRSYTAAVLAFLGLGGLALAQVAGGFLGGSIVHAIAKALLYTGGALPVAIALLGNGERNNARESSITATVAFASAVAAVETLSRSLSWSAVLAAVASADPKSKGEILGLAAREIAVPSNLGLALFGLAGVFVLVAVFRPAAELSREEIMQGRVDGSPLRPLGNGLAIVTVLAWFAALLATDVSGVIGRVAVG
jgi:hypothetical protein